VTGERQFDAEVAAYGTSSDDGDAQTHKGEGGSKRLSMKERCLQDSTGLSS
jgi:hypothetical protein